MVVELLPDIVTLTGIAVVVAALCHRARIPSIVGFLLTGALCGPHGLRLVAHVEGAEAMAEFGVVALLFTIGLEFSLKRLWEVRTAFVLGGTTQVVLTCAVIAAISLRVGMTFSQALFMGFLVSLSSTALVMSLMQSRAETHSPQGRVSLAILLYQDTIVVVMILLVPVLAGTAQDVVATALRTVGLGIGLVAVSWLCARWVVPWVLYQITRMRDREVFVLAVVFLVCAETWLTSAVGLSLALGAFLAGLIISESAYSQRVLGSILPFRDVFTSFFFIATGMLLDARYVGANLDTVLSGALALMVLKAAVAGLAALTLGWPLRTAIITGMALSQIGEFSFVLFHAGARSGLIGSELQQPFLAMSVVTMVFTPLAMLAAPHVAALALRLPLPSRLRGAGALDGEDSDAASLSDHLVIVGFGLNGRNLARAARAAQIPYTIVEMNPETVMEQRRRGEPIHYGDATQEPVLEHVGIRRARVAVVAISDAAATRRATELIRHLNPTCHIIVRTRFAREVKALHALGANEVVPEEFETSIEIFARVLRTYLVPRAEIDRLIAEIRGDNYEMLRRIHLPPVTAADLRPHLAGVEINTVRICPTSALAGKTLMEAQLPRTYGVTVLVIRRHGKEMANPPPETVLAPGDILIVMGDRRGVAAIAALCEGETQFVSNSHAETTQVSCSCPPNPEESPPGS